MIIHGLVEADKKERQKNELLSEAWDMKNESHRIASEKKSQAVKACNSLCMRKNATIDNLRGFKDDLQTIINLELIIDDLELISVEKLHINRIESFKPYQTAQVTRQTNIGSLVEMINPFTGGIGGSIERDAEKSLQRADYEYEIAKQVKSSNMAEAELYEQIARLAEMQKQILSKLNSFFNHGRTYVRDVIEKNGQIKSNYSEEERKKITLMVQCAKCMNAFLDVEFMNQEHKLTEQAKKLMNITEKFLQTSIEQMG